jgi:predicted DNA-binding protein (MmcQ/YjbR family)
MTIEDIQQICKKLKGVTQDIKWSNHLCFNVGGKMFLITAPDEVPPSASIKVSDDAFEELPAKPGFMAAPYLARYKWIRLDDISLWSKKEWTSYLQEAHKLVGDKLPLKIKKDLGLVTSEKTVRKSGRKS